MKQLLKISAILIAIALFAFILPQPGLVGKWRFNAPDGSTSFIDFKADSSFNFHTASGETIHEGKFRVVEDTFFISDADCGEDMWGKYKLTFVTEDSLNLKLIDDDCTGRAQQADGTALKRVKE